MSSSLRPTAALAILGTAAVLPLAGWSAAASPALGQAGTPPPVVECTVEPRPLKDVLAVVATPLAEAPAPWELPGQEPDPLGTPVPVRFTPAFGEPVDAATEAAVAAVAAQYVACANADDVLALAALVSDDFLRGSFAAPPTGKPGAGAGVFLATPEPRPEVARTTLLGVREVGRLKDGRLGALVDVLDPTNERAEGAPSTDYLLLLERDGALLIDEYRAGVGVPPAATPTA
jgi:hypothetical protein